MRTVRVKAVHRCSLFVLLCLVGPLAQAHPGHEAASLSFFQGLVHPLLGLDHLLAMLIVGVWAAQIGGRARVWLPASFVALMAIGALAPHAANLPTMEGGIVVSLLALGLAVALAWRAALPLAIPLVGLFALFHGAAHGIELQQLAHPLLYASGFLIQTAALHLVGLSLGAYAQRRDSRLARAAGWLGVVVGAGLALG